MGEGFAEPNFQRLADERKARNGDEDFLRPEVAGDPVGREAFARSAGTDEFPALLPLRDEMLPRIVDGGFLMRPRF